MENRIKHLKPCAIKRLQRRAAEREKASKIEQNPNRTVIIESLGSERTVFDSSKSSSRSVTINSVEKTVLIDSTNTVAKTALIESTNTVVETGLIESSRTSTVEKIVLNDSARTISKTVVQTVDPLTKPKQYTEASTQTENTCAFCSRGGMILSTCQGCTKYLDSFRVELNEQENKRWTHINRVDNRKFSKPNVPKPPHKPTCETLKYTVEKNEEIPDFAAHIDRHREQLVINTAKEKVEAKKKRLREAEESASRIADVLSRPEVAKTGIRTREDRVFLNSKYKSNRITHNNQPVPSKTKPVAVSNH